MEKTKNRFRDLSEKILIFALGIIFFGGVFAAWNDIKTNTDILTAQDWNDLVANIGGGGSWTVSGDDVYRETGNVGIGTTAPSEMLEIVTNSLGTVALKVYDGFTDEKGLEILGGGKVILQYLSGVAQNQIGVSGSYFLGNLGIGTITPVEKLDVVGNIKASGTVCDSNGCIGDGGALAGSGKWVLKWSGSATNVPNTWGTGLYAFKTSVYFVTMSVPKTDVDSYSLDYSDNNRCYYTTASNQFSCDGTITEAWKWEGGGETGGALSCVTKQTEVVPSTGDPGTICDPGYTMTGGGCFPHTDGTITASIPLANGWTCSGSPGPGYTTITAIARCCKTQ